MRKLIILMIMVMVVISCRKESPFASLSGNVYYYGIAIPIRDVRVKVDQNITYSGAEGSYDLPGIRKGVYTVRADKEGFDTYNYEMKFFDDLVFHNIQMVSDIYTSRVYGNINGDYSGEPRAGLRCVFMNPNGTESDLRAITDSSGFYEISMVPAGNHFFKVIKGTDVVYQDYLDVGADDMSYDIVLPDMFRFVDERDGREYSALKIDSLSWMTENLAFLPYVNEPDDVSGNDRLYYVYGYEGRDTYDAKATDNYINYGVLYNWKAAITACPPGWRLPSDEEWKSLERYLGMDEFEAGIENWRNSGDVGIRLKDSLGWAEGGNGDNSSWFNAIPGGYNGFNGGSFGKGFFASFWTSTKCGDDAAWHRYLNADEGGVFRLCNYTRYGYSVRCVK